VGPGSLGAGKTLTLRRIRSTSASNLDKSEEACKIWSVTKGRQAAIFAANLYGGRLYGMQEVRDSNPLSSALILRVVLDPPMVARIGSFDSIRPFWPDAQAGSGRLDLRWAIGRPVPSALEAEAYGR
jgi:hypothetical protein